MSSCLTTPVWEVARSELMVKLDPDIVVKHDVNHLSADSIVKVPQMAESITEGTLKQFTKRMNLLGRCSR